MQQNLIYGGSKDSRLQQTIKAAVRDPKKLLRDPLWGRDPPVGNHWLRVSNMYLFFCFCLIHIFAMPLTKHSTEERMCGLRK